MSRLISNTLASFLAGFLMLAPAVSNALIVFDPSNFAQNSITAVKQVFQEIKSITAEIHRLQQLKQLIQSNNPMAIGNIAKIAGIDANIKDLNSILSTSQRVYGIVDSNQKWTDKMMGVYAASGQTFESFMKDYGKRAQLGDARAQAMFDQQKAINDNLAAVSQQRQQAIAAANNSKGTVEALQANSAMLDILVSQSQQLNSAMATQLREAANAQAQKNADDKNAADAAQRMKAIYDEAAKNQKNAPAWHY
jgi:P-type conjugative transfer protein TrbJ